MADESAMQLFSQWANAWDKRVQWAAWVTWMRILLQSATEGTLARTPGQAQQPGAAVLAGMATQARLCTALIRAKPTPDIWRRVAAAPRGTQGLQTQVLRLRVV